AVLRIDREGERPYFPVALAEREGVDRLAGREVDDLEVLLIGVLNVEARAVLRPARGPRDARRQRNLRRDPLGGFVDDDHSPGVGANVDRAGAAGQLRRAA